MRFIHISFFLKKLLTNTLFCVIISTLSGNGRQKQNLGVAQVVERYLGVVEAVGSSPATQTKKRRLGNLRFFFYYLANALKCSLFRMIRMDIFLPLKWVEYALFRF